MVALNQTFDANTVEPTQSFDPIPSDWYNVVIENSEMKPNSSNTGSYIQLTMKVLDGPYANAKLWDRLNINNPNKTAEEIAYKTLSSICHATGKLQVADTAMLHNIPMQAKVTVKPAEGNYAPSNEIKAYKALENTMNGSPMQTGYQAQQQQQQQQQPVQGGWGNQAQQQQQQQQQPVQAAVEPSQVMTQVQPVAHAQQGAVQTTAGAAAQPANSVPPWQQQ